MIFRQLFDPQSSTYTYLLADPGTREAILVDPVFEHALVVVCRSGARSAQATVLLKGKGIAKVANLAGGMLRWRAQRLPVEGAADRGPD